MIVVLATIYCISSCGAPNVISPTETWKVIRFPVSVNSLKELGLAESHAFLTNKNSLECKQTMLEQWRSQKLQHLDTVFEFIEKKVDAYSLVFHDSCLFLVLTGKDEKLKKGGIHLPIHQKLKTFSDLPASVARDYMSLFYGANFGDQVGGFRETPFSAKEIIENNDRIKSKSMIERWGKSLVIYNSGFGDDLFVLPDNSVAWYQLETGRVLEAGKFDDWIISFFLHSLSGEPITSWSKDLRLP